MTLLSELIDIPERVHKSDFVISLATAVGQPEQTLRDCAVTRPAGALAAVRRAYRRALAGDDAATAEGLLAWVGGEPHMAASVKRSVGIRGDLDHDGPWPSSPACSPSCGGAGYAGLVLVLDEVETLQRVRSDARGRALNALRQLIDEVDQGGFPQDTPSVALALAEPVDGWHGE